MSRLLNRMYGRTLGWFGSQDASSGRKPMPKMLSRRAKLMLYTLEDRTTPAFFKVTTIADTSLLTASSGTGTSGDPFLIGTLRSAIEQANSLAGADTITFDSAGAFAGPATIAQSVPLTITGNTTITGTGSANLTLDAAGTGQVLIVNGTAITVALSGMKVTGGKATNGGGIDIFNDIVTLNDVTVSGNSASGAGANGTTTAPGTGVGAGILVRGGTTANLSITSSNISGNTSNWSGGGLYVVGGASVTVDSTTVTGNSSVNRSGAGLRVGGTTTNPASLTVTNSTITGNTAFRSTGGIYLLTGNLTLSGSTVSNNQAGLSAPGIIVSTSLASGTVINISNSKIDANIGTLAVGNGSAGGLSISGGNPTVTITNTSITNNSNYIGGAMTLLSLGTATVPAVINMTGCTLSGNTSSFRGGGVYMQLGVQTLNMTNCTVSGNKSGSDGGGLAFIGAGTSTLSQTAVFKNTTISGNTVTGTLVSGGGIFEGRGLNNFTFENSTISGNKADLTGGFAEASFGSTSEFPGLVTFRNSTVTGNTATSTKNYYGNVGGVGRLGGAQTFNIVSSIVSGNVGAATNPDISASATSPPPFTLTNSIVGNHLPVTVIDGSSSNVIYSTNPGLAPLANNGGPVQTHLPFYNSIAIDKGSNPATLTTDARGAVYPRVVGLAADVGAVERTITTAAPNVTGASNPTVYTFTVTYNTPIDTTTLGGNDVQVTPTGGTSIAAVYTPGSYNSTTFTATYTITPPGGTWDVADANTYTITLLPGGVKPTGDVAFTGEDLGVFTVVLPSTYHVSTIATTGTGSLADAIALSNASVGVADTIVFDSLFATAQTISVPTTLLISDSVTITGPAIPVSLVGTGTAGIITVNDGADSVLTVSLSNMDISGGSGTNTGGTQGGGLTIAGENVTLTGVSIHGNTGVIGGGIYGSQGTQLTIKDSVIYGNSVSANGAGIFINGSTNTNTGADAKVAIQNSTLSGNSAVQYGGAFGGFNWQTGSVLTVTNSTITLNTAGTTGGGGILVAQSGGAISIVSSVVSQNVGPTTGPDIFAGVVNASNSAIGSFTGFTFGTNTNNRPAAEDPKLGALANNGGPTLSHLPATDSPLLDVGTNTLSLPFDQRGTGFFRKYPNTAAGVPDIGAVEQQTGNPAPTATVGATPNVTTTGASNPYTFMVTYTDDTKVSRASIVNNNNAITVTTPSGVPAVAVTYVPGTISSATDGSPLTATYQFTAPGGTWDASDDGVYTVNLASGQVLDTGGKAALGGPLLHSNGSPGTFAVVITQTFTVLNDLDDGSAGSLRTVLAAANKTIGASDTILFDSTFFATPRVIALTGTSLPISDGVTITGPGAANVTIDAGAIANRAIDIDDGTSTAINVTISGVTISNGTVSGNGQAGGGIRDVGENLTVLDSVISKNTVTGAAGFDNTGGGGIGVVSGGALTVRRSTLTNNVSQHQHGGAIYFGDGGSLLLDSSTLNANTASQAESGYSIQGGGVFFSGTVGTGGFVIQNSTLYGNTAAAGGAVGFREFFGAATIRNSTITANTSMTTVFSGIGQGAVIFVSGTGTVALTSTIVSDNFADGAGKDVYSASPGSFSATFSAIGEPAGNTITSTGNNITNSTGGLSLDPLDNYGGPTQTVRLHVGSAAANAGSNPTPALTTDQRGNPRSVGVTDIGAFEQQTTTSPNVVPLSNGGVGVNINTGVAGITTASRSRVLDLVVTFSQVVTVGPDAFTLTRPAFGSDPNAATLVSDPVALAADPTLGKIIVTSTVVGGQTVVTLKFAVNPADTGAVGEGVEYGSLSDGSYVLTVNAASVKNIDGIPMDFNFATSNTADSLYTDTGRIYRLFGNDDGNTTVDLTDLADFRTTFTSVSGDPSTPPFKSDFDFDANGTVDLSDLSAFRQRFTMTV